MVGAFKPELVWRWDFSPAHNGAKAPSPGERDQETAGCSSMEVRPTITSTAFPRRLNTDSCV